MRIAKHCSAVMKVMKVAALVLLFVAGAFAACESDPDHTNEGIFYQDCKPGDPFLVNSFQVNNDDGSPNYPVKVDAPVDVVINFTNRATQSWDHIVIAATIARYTDVFGFCSWIGIPTFGLLDHLDACSLGSAPICPVPPGVSILKQRIDLTPFNAIINILSVSEPYRLTLSIKSGNTELGCAILESKIRK